MNITQLEIKEITIATATSAVLVFLACKVLRVGSFGLLGVLVGTVLTWTILVSIQRGWFQWLCIRLFQPKPQPRDIAEWEATLRRQKVRRSKVAFAVSASVSLFLSWYVYHQLHNVIPGVLIFILYLYIASSRRRISGPYAGLSLQRVGADEGEPVSVRPLWLGWIPIALMWAAGKFPSGMKQEGKRNLTPWAIIGPLLPAGLAILDIFTGISIPFIVHAVLGLVGFSFWLFWALLGWPAIRYILTGHSINPDVIITYPKITLLGIAIVAPYNSARLFNRGNLEGGPFGRFYWNPGVLSLGAVAGHFEEPMNFPWVPPRFMLRVLSCARNRS